MPPMPVNPLGEDAFKRRMLDDLIQAEAAIDRVYTDHVGIPTMAIGKALATRSGSGQALVVMSKAKLEKMVQIGTENAGFSLPDADYKLLTDTVAETNAGNVQKAQDMIPPVIGRTPQPGDNRFSFTLTQGGMEAIAGEDIDTARNRALSTYHKQVDRVGWSDAQASAYEADFLTAPQMLAFASMAYNGVIAPKGTRAMMTGDVPESYDQIVYQSNGGASRGLGIARRRIREGDMFLEGYEPQTVAEIRAWAQHAEHNQSRLEAYRAEFPKAFEGRPGWPSYQIPTS